ncbi:MAG TPA: PQQ-dependent sugar dehydrogenase [Nitrososphaeraceae archaeon]|nr:PQQ-dependent sugar dehydrogenase [Nitrososphaeraceae archaeon]
MHKSVLTLGCLSITLIILSVIPFFTLNDAANATRALPISEGPIINDVNLKAEVVFAGLTSPTSIAFLGSNDILVLEKDKGTVKRIVNGNILAEPLLELNVANDGNRGMLGIAVLKGEEIGSTNIFLYFTEAPLGEFPIGNRVYKYELVNNKLVNPELLLNLPALPGPSHNGGALMLGPDNNIYTIIGDVGGHRNQAQNQESGGEPDATSGILRITPDGMPVVNSPLGDREPLNLYYSYGVRNSFGFDFDPITGKLWNTENGEDFGDEINLVEPGFNSGWNKIQGIWILDEQEGMTEIAPLHPQNGLVDFGGKGKYSPPEFTWRESLGPSAIKFLNSARLGIQYENDIFVGDISKGNLYHFDLNKDRTQLFLEGPLADKVADADGENEGIIFGHGFGAITDIEVGPDDYLYIVGIQGTIYRIVPNQAEALFF